MLYANPKKGIAQGQAAILLGLTERQVRRIARIIRKEGDKGICRKFRGKRSHNRIEDKIKDKAVSVCRIRYKEFGPTRGRGAGRPYSPDSFEPQVGIRALFGRIGSVITPQ